jgi:acyl-CoA dehydrogenase
MSYAAPVADIAFALRHASGLEAALEAGLYGDDLTGDVVDAVLEEAGKYASDVIAPLNAIGDRHATPCQDGRVTMPPG